MSSLLRTSLAAGLVIVLTGCGTDVGPPKATSLGTRSDTAASTSAPRATRAADPAGIDVNSLEHFAPLAPGPYYIEPKFLDPRSPRVHFTIGGAGWSQFLGAYKPWTTAAGAGRVGVAIVFVENVVEDGCRKHRPSDPPIGERVGDLADALVSLAPFGVAEQPTDVTRYGYSGKHLVLELSDVEYVKEADGDVSFTGCTDGEIWSWYAPPLSGAFYGYQPGDAEEFWILDVDRTRVVINTITSQDSPPEALAEQRNVLDSIRIEP